MESVEPTQVKAGQPDSLPSPRPTDTEAHQRAPTLLASSEAGSGGEVRIWAPGSAWLWRSIGGWGTSGVILLSIMLVLVWPILSNNPLVALIGVPVVLAGWAAAGFATTKRPAYLATDGTGISFPGPQGTRTLRWSEISSVTRRIESLATNRYWDDPLRNPHLILQANEKIMVNLYGYSERVQNELFHLIRDRAKLVALPTHRGCDGIEFRCVRPDSLPPARRDRTRVRRPPTRRW